MDRRTFLIGTPSPAARSASAEVPGFTETPSLEPYTGPWGKTEVYHLLRRTVVAPTHAEVEQAAVLSMSELVDLLLAPSPALPAPPRFVGECLNASALSWHPGLADVNSTFFDELRRWWIFLMITGGLSIRERMTLFWHNHFAVNARFVQDARYLYLQNQLFRRYALGNFKSLVSEVTRDKAMLLFLDGRSSKQGYVNENYARELQELFTIGIADNDGNPNYAQEDIVQASKVLTGWDWVGLGMEGDVVNNLLTGHDFSEKSVYGERIAGSMEGLPELNRLLDVIFAEEETARYVIRKLYRFFVYTDTTLTPVRPIPQEIEENIIAPLAADFRTGRWEVTHVLRRLLTSRHFYDRSVVGGTIKSPVDLFVGAIRGTLSGTFAGDPADFATQYAQRRAAELDQDLFHPPGVQGWQFYRSWISSNTLPKRHFHTDELLYGASSRIIDRLNLVFNGPINRDGSWKIDSLAFARQFSSFENPVRLVRDLAEHLLAFPPSENLLTRLQTELVEDRAYEWLDLEDEVRGARIQKMLRYLMRSTNFQLM